MNWWIYWVAQVMVGVGCLYLGNLYGAAKQQRAQGVAAARQHDREIEVPAWHPEAKRP